MWRFLFSRLSKSARAQALALALLGVLTRALVVLAALRVDAGEARAGVLFVAVSSAVYLAQRALASALRTRIECELHAQAARALLQGDILDVPPSDLEWTLFDANYTARSVLAATLPSLFADALVALLLVPVLGGVLPARPIVWSLVAVAVIASGMFAVRRVVQRAEASILAAHRHAIDMLYVALEGRLEIVSRGREERFFTELEDALSKYGKRATKLRIFVAAAGRVPLASGALVIGVAFAFDGAFREVLTATAASNALILAACAPTFLGVVRGVSELVRARPRTEGLVSILRAPARAEESGAARVSLPSVITGDALTFSYDACRPDVLTRLSFAWRPGKPLVLTGPNGSGKSTLLRLLLGLRPSREGELRIADRRLAELDLPALRKDVALLPQRPYLGQAYHSVRDAMWLLCPDAGDNAILDVLAKTGMLDALRARGEDPLAARVGELSAGQRQRVALARVLLQDAKLVLLDEPDANLDRPGIELVVRTIDELTGRGAMVAVAAHTPELAQVDAVRIDLTKA